jgi:maltose/maltodextrin transport system substrate-binding protein
MRRQSIPLVPLFVLLGVLVLPEAIPRLQAAPAASEAVVGSRRPIFPGEPDVRPFWNHYSTRFIWAPAFDLSAVAGASRYRFTLHTSGGEKQFTAAQPWAPLSPVWDDVPEGMVELSVAALNAAGEVVASAGERTFYRSPLFSGSAAQPIKPYADAGRWALEAIYQAPHVQHWLVDGNPDRRYRLYCYPPKVMGALVRAMVAYSRVAKSSVDHTRALEIGRRVANHLIAISAPESAPYPHFPPTYTSDVNDPLPAAAKRTGKWMFVPAAADTAFGYLDLYDATHDTRYLDAAKAIASTYRKTQGDDGTWYVMVDHNTGEPIRPNRQIPTWIMFLFDRLERQHGITDFKSSRERAWRWIVENPLKSNRWEGQFEDGTPGPPYRNLAREQACDVAGMLLDAPDRRPEDFERAEELLRFAEDQFVIWSPIKDAAGWNRMPNRRKATDSWITPSVMEQYGAYAPVARSSAILIHAYLKAFHATNRAIYREKARALANGLIIAQAWMAATHDGNGEIPTWLTGHDPINWLNNSFYAADAVSAVAAEASAN